LILMHKNFMWNNIMRTTLGLSEELLAKAMSASQIKTKQNKTKTQVITRALQKMIRALSLNRKSIALIG